MMTRVMATVLLICLGVALTRAAEPVKLIEPDRENGGWELGNGPEFPGAKGGLSLDPTVKHDQAVSVKLQGDFSGGGNYVQAGRTVPDVTPSVLSFWLRYPGAEQLTVRLIDSGGTCHQLPLKIANTDQWQQVQFPVADFFKHMGTPGAVAGVTRYEKWGGPRNAGWTPPLKAIYILMGKGQVAGKAGALWLADMQIVPVSESGQIQVALAQTIALDELLQAGINDWGFVRGEEFPGAKGELKLVKDQPEAGRYALHITGDFTGGGAYVAATKDLTRLQVQAVSRITMRIKSSNVKQLTVRVGDATDQWHQARLASASADGQWHEFTIDPKQVAGGEHWGGANDGKLHSPIRAVSIVVAKGSAGDDLKPELWLTDVKAEVVRAGQVKTATFHESFEQSSWKDTWSTRGQVSASGAKAFKGERALHLERSEDDINKPTESVSKAFPAAPGQWEISGAAQGQLYSPDNSYHGRVNIEWLDAGGRVIERTTVDLTTQKAASWQPFRKIVETPQGTTAGRIEVSLQKTYGWYEVDDLKAAHVAAASAIEKRIDTMHVKSDATGNLFLPEAPVVMHLSVQAFKPLRQEELEVTYVVRDYWGAEQAPAATVTLQATGYNKDRFGYRTDIDLSKLNLTMGKYYELYATVQGEGGDAITEYRGLARLPLAVSKQYEARQIPFTIRNWDSRIGEYFHLADRLGIRQIGLWGGWKSEPPYNPSLPGLDTVGKLGAVGVAGLPGSAVERGNEKYTDQVLRDGMKEFLAKYGGANLAMLSLGNEPHGGAEQVRKNVAAYRALYEAAKQANPDIFVIATSVEPNEEYFRQGYYKYLDAYDFHTYEGYQGIRRTIEAYKALMTRYDAVKPIYSTELGSNSQGMTRYAVAVEMVKKLTTFFAADGQSASWFTIMYPDPQGKARGTFGDAHCVFDCRYSEYNPRIDAITYYNMVNGICIKKFLEEKGYDGGVKAFLFTDADGQCLQVIWNEGDRRDVFVPLAGVQDVRLVRIDGSDVMLKAVSGGVTIGASVEPVLLHYQQAQPKLAEVLAPGRIRLDSPIPAVVKGGTVAMQLAGDKLSSKSLTMVAPPGWSVALRDVIEGQVQVSITAPAQTQAREGRLLMQQLDGKGIVGEIIVSIPVTDRLAVTLLPGAGQGSNAQTIRLGIANHQTAAVEVDWQVDLLKQYPMAAGKLGLSEGQEPTANLAQPGSGHIKLEPGQATELAIPLANVDAQTLYRTGARVSDAGGRTIEVERLVGGFLSVPRATQPVQIDGQLDEKAWANAPVANLNEARQWFAFGKLESPSDWTGPGDLSGKLRFLWDDQYLYVAVEVTDDIFAGKQVDSAIWNQDGLQFLIDPVRHSSEKPGKYDYCAAVGSKGPQVWCNGSASQSVPAGEVTNVKLAVKRMDGGAGSMVYEIAFPWASLAPFQPGVGANLGLCLIINEDDGPGRKGFIGWFGGAHSKELDHVGDLILGQ
ncbi:MAG: sugar-binding protein [Phycisphaeraceae bacterium]